MKLNIEIECEKAVFNPAEFKKSLRFLTDERDEAFRNSFECEQLMHAIKVLIDNAERDAIYDSASIPCTKKVEILKKGKHTTIEKVIISVDSVVNL